MINEFPKTSSCYFKGSEHNAFINTARYLNVRASAPHSSISRVTLTRCVLFLYFGFPELWASCKHFSVEVWLERGRRSQMPDRTALEFIVQQDFGFLHIVQHCWKGEDIPDKMSWNITIKIKPNYLWYDNFFHSKLKKTKQIVLQITSSTR